MPKLSIGLDFGTESVRAVAVDLDTGSIVGKSTATYPHGVIERRLPLDDAHVDLEPGTALQDPHDYLSCLGAVMRDVLSRGAVLPQDVVGIGVSFTSSTVLPVDADGASLCADDAFRHNPHAWVKLWKHHTAQQEADDIDVQARKTDSFSQFLGRTSCEWYFPKLLETYRHAPEVYRGMHRFIEAGDWVVSTLTGEQSFSACTAGFKAGWSSEGGFRDDDFFDRVEAGFRPGRVVPQRVVPLGVAAGELCTRGSSLTGLMPGTPVSPAVIDAHASVTGSGVTAPGEMVLIMGTSLCHMLLDERLIAVRGIAGAVPDGIIPGYVGYEGGQPALGDMLRWASRMTGRMFDTLEREAANVQPGSSGLLALDWLNGNRSILDDAELSGLVMGLSLSTTPGELYRALIESAAFATRVIVENFVAAGLAVNRFVACGGVARRSPLLLQIFADVLGAPIERSASEETSALGAAIHGAVVADHWRAGMASFGEATRRLVPPPSEVVRPEPRNQQTYDRLYPQYRRLHDLHGVEERRVMIELQEIRRSLSTQRSANLPD